jgi:hypothetical protein
MYGRAIDSDSNMAVLDHHTCIPVLSHPHDNHRALFGPERQGDPMGSRLPLEMERRIPKQQTLCRISCLVPHSRASA